MDLLDAKRHRISVDEFHAMGEAGILHEDDRIELIDGRLVVMEPIGRWHANAVIRLTRLLVERTPHDISPQNPLRLSDNTEPLPDFVVLHKDRDPSGHLVGPDALIVIEVADTSLSYDRDVKLARYARAGVPEVWIVDVRSRQVERYRRPEGGTFAEMSRPQVLELPDGQSISIEEIFGAQSRP